MISCQVAGRDLRLSGCHFALLAASSSSETSTSSLFSGMLMRMISPSSTSAIGPPLLPPETHVQWMRHGKLRRNVRRDQCHAGTQSHSCDGRSRIQHLTHAGASLGAFVTDYHYVTCHDSAGLNGINSILFTVEYSGRALVYQHLRCHADLLTTPLSGARFPFSTAIPPVWE